MSEMEMCPLCGTRGRLILTPAGGGRVTRTYEPLGLDALERSVVEIAFKIARRWREEGAISNAEIHELTVADDDLLFARAAHVGKEAGE